MVILVMTDGVRPDALDAVPCPTFDTLRAGGASTLNARSVMPSVTLPCHMSIFHSVPPERHGITTNLYIPMARPLPGLIETLHAAGKRSALIHNWEPLRDINRPETLAFSYYREPPNDHTFDDAVAAEGVAAITSGEFDFIFIYLGGVDIAGHVYGWMSDGYLTQLTHLDAALGRITAAMPAHASIIVHSDHGGHERTHGTESPEDMTIPWIAAGPPIHNGHTILGHVGLVDTAPTICRLLDVAPHPAWEGRVVHEIFTS
ncbi:MAG TPA: alkaline phosphatase family protein [Roseiflexaceae bacterium]|nr:alkaline phosphatase family protein [Roseiflexaceae bacterium]HMP40419.1 alkaline phosphatase family protein [Roseiflexaceae bacterium]